MDAFYYYVIHMVGACQHRTSPIIWKGIIKSRLCSFRKAQNYDNYLDCELSWNSSWLQCSWCFPWPYVYRFGKMYFIMLCYSEGNEWARVTSILFHAHLVAQSVADFFAPAFTPQVRQFQRDILSSVLGYSSFYRLDMPFSKTVEPLDCCCISGTGKCDRMELERD